MTAWLLALAASAQAPERPADYVASGSEPFWGLEIRGRQLRFSPNDNSSEPIAVPLPRRQPVRGGYNLVTRRFTVQVRHRLCEDEAERRYRDTVRVRMRGYTYVGCGGTLLPPAMLERTDWRIESIGGTRVSGDNYVMGFYEARLRAQAGCNQLSGPFRERGNRLSAGPIAATRMACPGPRMAHERAVLRLLGGPVHFSFPAGDVLVLSGSGVTLRLRRV